MARFLIILVLIGLVGAGVYHFQSSTPAVNANMAASDLEEALVLPMGQLTWELEADAAFTRARQDGKPVLMLFTAKWCGPCRNLHAGPLADPEVQGLIADRFIPLYVDLTDRVESPATELAQGYKVRSIPRLLVTNAKGKVRDNTSGSKDKATLIRWLKSEG